MVELSYRWAPNGRVEWSEVRLEAVEPPEPRRVVLATVHLRPESGSTPSEKCEQFAGPIAEAAERGADLVVLPETLTYYQTGRTYAECAEPIPGPSTEFFGRLARRHDLYIVAGLLERDRHLVYNVAVLIGPDGDVVGKYRKVTLPRGEIEGGVTPGSEYPGLRHAVRQARDDGLLRRVLPRGRPRAEQPRGGGHRLAGLGLQPAAGRGAGVRESCLRRQQHLYGCLAATG